MRIPWDSTTILSIFGPPQSNYVIWMEMSLRYLKWVFDGIQFHHVQQKLWIDLWKDINFPQFSNLRILLNHIVLLFSPMYNTLYQQQVVIANTVMGQPHKTLLFFGNLHNVIMGLFLAWVKWWGPSFSKGGEWSEFKCISHKSIKWRNHPLLSMVVKTLNGETTLSHPWFFVNSISPWFRCIDNFDHVKYGPLCNLYIKSLWSS